MNNERKKHPRGSAHTHTYDTREPRRHSHIHSVEATKENSSRTRIFYMLYPLLKLEVVPFGWA